MKRSSRVLAVLIGMFSLLGLFPNAPCIAQGRTDPNSLDPYFGIYRLKTGDFVSIANFDLGDGQNRMLFTAFKSGIVRILSPSSPDAFTGGTGLLLNPPVEMKVSFARDA